MPSKRTIRCNNCAIPPIYLELVGTGIDVNVSIGLQSKMFKPGAAAAEIRAWLDDKNIALVICRDHIARCVTHQLATYL